MDIMESVEAIVCPGQGMPYEYQPVMLNTEPREDEILVRMVATGICHTDFATANVRELLPLPPSRDAEFLGSELTRIRDCCRSHIHSLVAMKVPAW